MPAETILVADDEATVRLYIRSILRREGFNVLEAVDGVDAIEQIQRAKVPPDLLLTDVRMPRMDGISLARSMGEMYPGIPVVYISGYPLDLGKELTQERPCASLSKPFTRGALLEAVLKCLSPPQHLTGKTG